MTRKYKYCWPILTGMLFMLGLWTISFYNYILFHSIAELFSIVVACGIFMLAWNSRQFTKNSYFIFIGIAYLFIGNIDLVHTLAYKGMGIFPGDEANLSTQLWIAARYVESISLLIAPFLVGRKLKVNSVFLGYIIATAVLLGSILYWHIFPVCFIEGEGLTIFKKISEYIISLILLASVLALFNKRNEFDRDILRLLIASVVITIVSELAFTFYVDTYGFFNFIGHYLKIISFYLIYVAIIKTGLTRPFALLFRDLKQSEDTLRVAKEHLELEVGESSEKLQESIKQLHESEQHYRSVVEDSPGLICRFEPGGLITFVNNAYCNYFGKRQQELVGTSFFFFISEEDRETVEANIAALTPEEPIQMHEHRVISPDGQTRWQRWTNRAIFDKDGQVRGYQSFGEDITKRKQVELALNDNREKLTKAEQVARMGFLDWDIKTNKVVWSKEVYNLYGIDPGMPVTIEQTVDLVHPDDREFVNKNLDMAIQGISDYNIDHRIVRPDGEVIWVHARADLERDKEGIPVSLIGTVVDITNRKRASDALVKSEAQYRELIDNSLVGVFHNRLDGQFIFVNEALARMYDFDGPEQMVAEGSLSRWIDLKQRERFLDALQEHGSVSNFEAETITHTGRHIHVIFSAKLHIDSITGMVMDITERKQAELAVHEMASFAELNPAPVLRVNSDGLIMSCNPASLEILGKHAKKGTSLTSILPDLSKIVLDICIQGDLLLTHESRIKARYYQFIIRGVSDLSLVYIYGSDITERKLAEEEMNQLRSELIHSARTGTMVELTAALAHELNHPLGSILNNANAAKRFLESETPDLNEIREIISDIISEDKRANDVMQKLRTLMKKGDIQFAPLQINNIIEEVLKFTQSELIIENIMLSKQLANKLPAINGDRIQLQQVFLNLIINAIDAMKESKIKNLHISTAQHDSESIVICVKDSGVGFDEEKRGILFKPFFTTKKKGMGMGLSVNRTILKSHGGDIRAESNKEGASFFILLPIYKEKSS